MKKTSINRLLWRGHILKGLLKALDIIDDIIALIRASCDVDDARNRLVKQFGFTVEQADIILELRLRQLTGPERNKFQDEYDDIQMQIDNTNIVPA